MKTIIGLVGVKQSGKSTTASIIKKYYPNAKETALADKLKDVCADVFGLSRECFDDQRYKEIPFKVFKIKKILELCDIIDVLALFGIRMTCDLEYKYREQGLINMELESPRHIAQIIGTQILRQAGDSDIHCRNVDLNGDFLTIGDVRFVNEFDYFYNKAGINFIPIYISRDSAEAQVTENSHISEREVFLFRDKCIRLDNNGTLEDLEINIKQILFEIWVEILKNGNL